MLTSLYSPIQHLADAVFLNHNPHQRYFVIVSTETGYTTYFDASGTRGISMLVVGGYISTVDDWKVFERQWQAALDRVGVPYFHMKKFTAKREPFDNKKWEREEYRKDFLNDLIGVIARNVDFGIPNILPLADWKTVNGEYCMEEERMTPFSVAGCMAITAAFEWCKAHGIPFHHVRFIFENGDEDKGDLMHWTNRCWGFVPGFEDKCPKNTPKDPFVPLQACDFIAWEFRRAETDLDDQKINLDTFELRGCFTELLNRIRHDDQHARWSIDNLRQLCEKHKIPKRS